MVLVFFLKSGTLFCNPQCWVRPTKYAAQFAIKELSVITIKSHQCPEIIEIIKILLWKRSSILDQIIDFRCCKGWSLCNACNHSWHGISVDPILPKEESPVKYTVEKNPPLLNTRSGFEKMMPKITVLRSEEEPAICQRVDSARGDGAKPLRQNLWAGQQWPATRKIPGW